MAGPGRRVKGRRPMGIKVRTRLFGELDVPDDKVYLFPSGLYGLEDLRRFTLIEPEAGSPLKYMQSLDDGDISFVVLDPAAVIPDYRPEIPQEERSELGLAEADEGVVLVIAVVPEDIRGMTVNLRAPVVVNPSVRRGKQVILPHDAFAIKHRLFDEAVASGVSETSR